MLGVAGVSIHNSETFVRKETEGEKFHHMVEVIQATNDDLGVSKIIAAFKRMKGAYELEPSMTRGVTCCMIRVLASARPKA